jgi:hypothetical protein
MDMVIYRLIRKKVHKSEIKRINELSITMLCGMGFIPMSERSEEVFLVRGKLKQKHEQGFSVPIFIYDSYFSY